MSAANGEVVVIDFGMGNLRNVARALARAGAAPRITDDAAVVARRAASCCPAWARRATP
jgi:imidazoleglycerol phosphate synthase glutamine amidotransferase subunit HisH